MMMNNNRILFGNLTSLLENTNFHKAESTIDVSQIDKHEAISGICKENDQSLCEIKSSTTKFSFGKNQLSSLGSSSFSPLTKASNTPFTFSLTKSMTTTPFLFSTMNTSQVSSLDLQLYQTMVNTQPFNSELAFLARNIKPNVRLKRPRLSRPTTNSFSSILTKPSFITATKRKYDQTLIDDADAETDTLSKINFKRPRRLDMHKIRSLILGNNQIVKEELRFPRLTRQDYYIKPTLDELTEYFNDQGQCFVREFTIGRKHYGSIAFKGLHMNLAGLDLDRLVEIDHRQVTVYPNDKDRPNIGEELNCQAIISLIGIYPIDSSISDNTQQEITDPNRLIEIDYRKYLEKMTNKFQGHFIDYDVYTGTWTFQVEHF